MKKFLTIFTLIILNSPINAQDYYYYKGSKISLQYRSDKAALILNNEVYSETEVRHQLQSVLNIGDEVKKTSNSVYLLNFSASMSYDEILSYTNLIKTGCSIIKFATPVYFGSSKSVTQIPADKIILKLKNADDIDRLNSFNSLHNCFIKSANREGTVFIISTYENDGRNALALSDLFYSSGMFAYAEPDFIYPEKCLLLSIPNDPYFLSQWALKNSGQLLQTGSPFLAYGDASAVNGIPGADMNVEAAWEITTGSENVKIGIIDTGIDSLHPDFHSTGHLLPGYDAFNDLNSSAVDVGNHGTSTAGLAGAVMNNSIGISGIAPSCPLMSICIFDINGTTTSSIIARAFDTARVRGIDILSNSWGGGTPESIVTDAIDNAAINGRNGNGCIILFASGNDGRNPPIYPAVLPNVVCVGGSTPHDQAKSPGTGNQFYWGSNYGEDEYGDLDVVAPTNCVTLLSGGGYEENFWGTSATCPNAAGVAALILSVNPSQTKSDVVDKLLRGCDKIDNVPYDVQKTYGKWSPYYGYGRVNAHNSVMLASGTDVIPPSISHLNISSHGSTYPSDINAEITDQNGNSVPASGEFQPKLFYKIKKGTAPWTDFDSLYAYSGSGNNFTFRIPSQGWETQVKYYLRAFDNSGNVSEFPKHAPNSMNLCYFAVGNIISERKKFPAFSGADVGATLSSPVSFSNFPILNAKLIIHMRHTYLDDEVIQLYSPLSDASYNRKCLFASNGGDGDNIYDACVHDSASSFWREGTPPFLNGSFKPEYNLRGLYGNSALGSWRILHFDRGITDYAFFDSVKIILSKTNGIISSSVRHNQPLDSIVSFGNVVFPESAEKDFYIKNSGTGNLNISSYSIEGDFASMFSVINTPVLLISPNDSSLFKIKLTTAESTNVSAGLSSTENARLIFNTNDPSKPVFQVSLLTDIPLQNNLRNLRMNLFIEGLYNADSGVMIQDTVQVYLRNSAAPYDLVDSSSALVNSDGLGSFTFMNVQNNTEYYISVKYKNAIETWSAAGVSFISSLMNYDFTISQSQAYGNNLVLKGNKYCIYSGDVNNDGTIDAQDIGLVGNSAYQFQQGYLDEDLNGDFFIDATDTGIADNNVGNFISVITP